jgi:hypothetical protein
MVKNCLKNTVKKNCEIDVFADRFQVILMGFLNTPLRKNSQNDVKLLET